LFAYDRFPSARGEGFYTRLLRHLGADPVIGVDLSKGMIDLAKKQEHLDPLQIEYLVGDARDVKMERSCDLVFAAYLLNYSQNYEQLLAMCQAVAASLKPGGRFVTVNNNPDDPPGNFLLGLQYGFSKRLVGPLVEGAEIVYRFDLAEKSIEVTNYYLGLETMKRALGAAGLGQIRSHSPQVSEDGVQKFGHEHWQPFLETPPVIFLDCYKRPE